MTDSPEQTYPRWLVLLLVYVVGVLTPLAVLMPLASTPDYEKGCIDGFRRGMEANREICEASVEEAFQAGKRIACQ